MLRQIVIHVFRVVDIYFLLIQTHSVKPSGSVLVGLVLVERYAVEIVCFWRTNAYKQSFYHNITVNKLSR